MFKNILSFPCLTRPAFSTRDPSLKAPPHRVKASMRCVLPVDSFWSTKERVCPWHLPVVKVNLEFSSKSFFVCHPPKLPPSSPLVAIALVNRIFFLLLLSGPTPETIPQRHHFEPPHSTFPPAAGKPLMILALLPDCLATASQDFDPLD